MKPESFCAGHVNGFEHLSIGLGGLEAEWDLGFKFREEESSEFRVDPTSGVKAWAEPLLVLYISVHQKDSATSYPSLRYGLTRSKFSSGLSAAQADRDRLLELARPQMKTAIGDLMGGGKPASSEKVQML